MTNVNETIGGQFRRFGLEFVGTFPFFEKFFRFAFFFSSCEVTRLFLQQQTANHSTKMANKDREVVIIGCARTPVAKFQGAFSALTAPQLGAVAIKAAAARAGISECLADIDEVLMGNVVSAGVGQAPARQASVFAGVPVSVCTTTLNKVCGSGLKTAMAAASAIRAGDGKLYVAGGMECMTRAPWLIPGRTGELRFGNHEMRDSLMQDGLYDPFCQWGMGFAADYIAEEFKVSARKF
jgi:acetyl-CoA C-acetyltransferase